MEVDRVGWDAGRAGSGQHRVPPSVLLRCSTPILEITRRHFLQLGKLFGVSKIHREGPSNSGTRESRNLGVTFQLRPEYGFILVSRGTYRAEKKSLYVVVRMLQAS